VRLATWNVPYRLDNSGAKYRADMERLIAKHHPWVIALQETTDKSPAQIAPDGWGWVRPVKGQSASLIYRKSKLVVVDQGAYRLHSKDWEPVRYIVWARFRRKDNDKLKIIGSAHLVAFKESKPKNGKEFIKQQKRAANWIESRPKSTVVLGDWNGTPGDWTPDLTERCTPSKPRFETGPSGQKIDYAWHRKDKPNRVEGIATMKGVSDHKAYVCDG
jgi:exonuclease III